jgi:phosphoribosyl-dephospho-CoA transferase
MSRSRHDLVWLSRDGWAAVQAQAGPTDHAPASDFGAVARWRANDWPLVLRRRPPELADTQMALGLPLPPAPDGSKRRFACVVDTRMAARWQAPLTLAEAAHAAPARWQAGLQALLADCTRTAAALPRRPFAAGDGAVPLCPRVFGSLAMQALTGLSYLRAESDLDLLLAPESRAELAAALALLQRHAASLPLDGEIVFPGGVAVAWREYATAAASSLVGARVLVKDENGVHLATRESLEASLGPPC